MGRDFWPIASCSQAFTVLRTSFPQHQSSHRLLYHLCCLSHHPRPSTLPWSSGLPPKPHL